MSGYLYSDPKPTEDCPYCSTACEAEYCDVGIGYQQVTPFLCPKCGAFESGQYDSDEDKAHIDDDTGWYAPGTFV